jgi:hypothetical protein
MAAYLVFWGVTYSGSAFSAPVVSVFMSVILKGGEKLRVTTAFGASMTAADVATALVDCFVVSEYY